MGKTMVVLLVLAVTGVNAWMNLHLLQISQRPPPVLLPAIQVGGKVKQIGQQKIFRPQRQASEEALPPWSQLESDDYARYAANLRTIGCPEKTLRNLLAADIEGNFEEQKRQIWDDSIGEYWMSGDQREALRRERTRREHELVSGKWELLRELFGYAVDEGTLELARSDNRLDRFVAWLLVGFLEREQFIRVAGSTGYHLGKMEALKDLSEGILIPADFVKAEHIRDDFEAEITALMGAAAFEEALFRAAILKDNFELGGTKFGVNISGEEFRTIVKINVAAGEGLNSIFEHLILQDGKENRATKEEVDEAIAGYLGADKYADYVRAGDDRFRDLYTFATENGLGKKEAVKIFHVRDQMEQQLQELSESEIEPEDKLLLQVEIKARTEALIVRTFGRTLAQEYRDKGHAKWLDKMINVPELVEVQP